MQNAMDTKTAETVAGCREETCGAGEDDPCTCLESATCSTRCPGCLERQWFLGSWGNSDVPDEFACWNCGAEVFNPFTAPGHAQVVRWRKALNNKARS